MQKNLIALKQQLIEINRLKKCPIFSFSGFGADSIIVFVTYKICSYVNLDDENDRIKEDISEGRYKSIEEFDADNSAEIEFVGSFKSKNKLGKYHHKTMLNLIELGKMWRERINQEFPDSAVNILVYKQAQDWFLDTFNYPVSIEGAIYL